MDVKNCRKCGRLFNYIAGPYICPNCMEKEEAMFQKVKQYIRQNVKANMRDICENCDVDSSQIQQWIRQERLVFAEDSPIRVTCESCGKMIPSGRFCKECKDSMARKLNSARGLSGVMVEQPPERKKSSDSRMRFLDQ